MAWREEEEKKNERKTVLHEGWMMKSAVFIMLMMVIDYWFTLVWCYMAGTHVLELLISMGMDCN